MNIFYLDDDPKIAASFHCDKHCVKMILQSAQMLSTAHRVLDGDEVATSKHLYKTVSKNHPCTIWTRTNSENYEWLWKLYANLMKEYTRRYGKHHASEQLTHALWEFPGNISHGDFTDPPQCMPDEYKVENDTVQAFHNYYHGEKAHFAEWRLGEPCWWKGKV